MLLSGYGFHFFQVRGKIRSCFFRLFCCYALSNMDIQCVRKGNFCFIYTFIMFLGVVGKYFIMVRSFVGFCVGTAIICCWINIYRELRKLRKIRNMQDTSGKCKTWHRSIKRKVAKMFFSVVISLYVCYIPLWVRAIAYGFNSLKSPQYEIFAISLVLANSSVNPVIYSFTSKKFRDELFGRKTRSMS